VLSNQLKLALVEKNRRKIRPKQLRYLHFTDETGALAMIKEKKLLASSYISGVYAIAVGGANVPGVQQSKMGRAGHRKVAILFTTDELPDSVFPEEVVWSKPSIRLRTAKILPTKRALAMLDGSKVVRDPEDSMKDTIAGIPHHPTRQDPLDPWKRIRN
jgi:hypothetical protein